MEQPSHYHAYGRVQPAPARAMLFIKRDAERQHERMQTIKHCDGAGYSMCNDKEKVTSKTTLMYLRYPIRRAIDLSGHAGIDFPPDRTPPLRHFCADLKKDGIKTARNSADGNSQAHILRHPALL